MRTGLVGGTALLGSVLLGLAGCSSGSSRGSSATVSPTPTTAPSVESATAARRAASVLTPEVPVTATLPSGTMVPVRPATTTSDGQLAVPADIGIAGWWKGGSRLGDPFGSTLLAAHVDSATRGLGPFAELLTADRGDRVVLDSAHLTQDFVVDSLRLVPQGPLTDEEWLFESTGPHRLTLVTCAPPYVRDRGGYQNLVVVTAVPVSAPRRDRAP